MPVHVQATIVATKEAYFSENPNGHIVGTAHLRFVQRCSAFLTERLQYTGQNPAGSYNESPPY